METMGLRGDTRLPLGLQMSVVQPGGATAEFPGIPEVIREHLPSITSYRCREQQRPLAFFPLLISWGHLGACEIWELLL